MRRPMFFVLLATMAAGAWGQPMTELPGFASEIEAFAAADRVHPPKRCGLLFVGSSSIRLWQSLSTDMSPHYVINRGFGGSSISDVNHYFEPVVAQYRPRAIFFYAGENDLSAGKSPAQVSADFATFLTKKDRALGKTPVYFISLKPSKARFTQLRQQTEVNAAIRRLAAARSDLHYVDVASAMLKSGKPRDIFQEDALHMTDDGYRIWTRIIRPRARKAARRQCA